MKPGTQEQHLDQGTAYRTSKGRLIPIDEMEPIHARNAMKLMRRVVVKPALVKHLNRTRFGKAMRLRYLPR